jgi:hypothetical protein
MRDAIRFMALSGWESYHLAAKRGVIGMRGPSALTGPNAKNQGQPAAAGTLDTDVDNPVA